MNDIYEFDSMHAVFSEYAVHLCTDLCAAFFNIKHLSLCLSN